MAIIAGPTKEPVVLAPTDLVSVLAPAVRAASQCQQMLGAWYLQIFLRAFALLRHALWFTHAFTIRSLVLSKSALLNTAAVATRVGWLAWDCKTMRRFKKKLEFELFTIMLSTGNQVCVLVFWPGWWLIVLAMLTSWLLVG
ncbi:hypothetical protein Micbo1qcDRAFT_206752 [Microdochium bolleyi]|uniref:Uncharacterized protein n=1 Tax=Microdochium bolleyi TaxID=196109 RepID=A0A136IVW5_9PEZI|nr:hypothetical protein Micbo1qcDRAFT_206752 [Microdochium bolleyi]